MFKSALIFVLFLITEASFIRKVVKKANSKNDSFAGDVTGIQPDTVEDLVKVLGEINLKEFFLLYQCRGITKTPNFEYIQRGVRLFNHYDGTSVDSPEKCADKCRSDEKCLAMTFDIKHFYSNGNCFLYDSRYEARNDPSLNWFTWIKNQLELGVRLFDHYNGTFVDDVLQCKEHCVEDNRCIAMTFDSGKTYSNGNCFFYESGYRVQSDPKMQWTSWRKPK